MPGPNTRAKRSEKGLLTPDNCVITLIDHQPQMLFGVANFDRQTIINNTVALAKAAKVFDVPVVLSTVETKSFSGNLWPQIKAVFPEQTPIERTSMNAWDDKNFVAAIQKSGRKKIVLAGLWTETCVALPTVQALHDGFEIYVVEDCCGDVSQLAHDNAMKRETGHVAVRDARAAAGLGAARHVRRGHGHREDPLRGVRRRGGVRLHDGARRSADAVPQICHPARRAQVTDWARDGPALWSVVQ